MIIGITIAFSLNNWNEGRKDRTQEKAYLKALSVELEKDQNLLKSLLDTSSYFLGRTENLLANLSEEEFLEDSLALYLSSTYSFASFKPNNNTFEGLKTSGKIGLIEDFELRQKIIHHYNQNYGECMNFDDFYKTFLESQLMPIILKNVDFRSFPQIGNSEFTQNVYFINLMYSSQYYQATRIQIYQEALDHCETLIAELRPYL